MKISALFRKESYVGRLSRQRNGCRRVFDFVGKCPLWLARAWEASEHFLLLLLHAYCLPNAFSNSALVQTRISSFSVCLCLCLCHCLHNSIPFSNLLRILCPFSNVGPRPHKIDLIWFLLLFNRCIHTVPLNTISCITVNIIIIMLHGKPN